MAMIVIDDDLKSIIMYYSKYIGIKSSCVNISTDEISNNLVFSFSFDIPLGQKEFSYENISLFMKPTIDGIIDSELINDKVRKPLEKKIAELESRCKELETLIPYKQHFDVEMTLRHGRENTHVVASENEGEF